jgi:hypothetical protein
VEIAQGFAQGNPLKQLFRGKTPPLKRYLWIIDQNDCILALPAIDKFMQTHFSPLTLAYNRLMANSFKSFTGASILGMADAADLDDAALAQALFHLPQAIVSHGAETDPVFRYANQQALTLWEMDWHAFTRLPSRLSAESASDIQSDRDTLLKAALAKGWVDDYAGVRISSTGRRFHIRNTTLWNVVDSLGVHHGQAAFIRDWRFL